MSAVSLVLLALLAQTSVPPPESAAKAEAQTLLKQGAAAYEAGDLPTALDKFKQAYARFASPKLLFNIGQASRELGRFAGAMDAFERFLSEAPDAPVDMKAEAEQSIAKLQPKLGRLHVDCGTVGAEIGLDGTVVGHAPIAKLLWAMPGKHQVTARYPGTVPAIEFVEVRAGLVHDVVFRLKPLVPAEAVASTAPPVLTQAPRLTRERPSPRDQHPRSGRRWTWVAGGTAVALVGAAVIVGTSMQAKFDSYNKSCGSASPGYPGCSEADIQAVETRKTVANVLWGLSGVAAATAGVLFYLEGRRVTVAPMVGAYTGVHATMAY